MYFESLTSEQKVELERRYEAIDLDTSNRSRDLAYNTAIEVIGEDNWLAVLYVTSFPTALTYELIANLENPFFLPLVVPEFNYKQN